MQGQKLIPLYNFIPRTYILPKEYVQFSEQFYRDIQTEGPQNMWIIKPIGNSQRASSNLIGIYQ